MKAEGLFFMSFVLVALFISFLLIAGIVSAAVYVNEIELNQKDSSFYGKMYFNEPDENFYKIVLQQNGTDIPSKIF